MILEIDPNTPAWVRNAADALLYLHIGGGSVGLASGAAALSFRKGSTSHRVAGNIFFISMLMMSAIGASVAPFLPERTSSVAGILTFYLVATAWATVKRKENSTGVFEVCAFFVASGAGLAALALASMAASSPTGLVDGQPAFAGYLLASIAAIGAVSDLSVILRKGIAGAQRIARHLWRMCTALFLAATSFFLGQSQVFPEVIRESPILFAPVLATLLLMIFWLGFVFFTKRFKSHSPA